MKKISLLILASALLISCRAYAADNATERKEYREDMQRQTTEDYVDSERLREERRDMLRKGYTSEDIRAKQTEEIEERRNAPKADFKTDASATSGFSGNSAFSGFSTPKSRAGAAAGEKSASGSSAQD